MKKEPNNKIDFVILWVDGNDPEWLEEKSNYSHIKGDNGKNRFRDCDNLQYVFRSIEKYAPWVNNIFFITWGHIPKWMDTNNPKLKIVKHTDYIPTEYLPTYNSNVIELNLHRIKELSENFVLFNDDLFLLKPTKDTDFFLGNKPRDVYSETIQLASFYNDVHYFMKANILAIINQEFNKPEVMKKNLFKFINPKYKKLNCNTLISRKVKNKFCGFWNFHAPQPYLKSTFEKIWDKRKTDLETACLNKFRNSSDLGHYLCRYWQMLEGNFVPKIDESKYFVYNNNNTDLINAIENQKYKTICINDAYTNIDFDKAISEVNQSLDKILPNKCSFELYSNNKIDEINISVNKTWAEKIDFVLNKNEVFNEISNSLDKMIPEQNILELSDNQDLF